MQSEDEDRAEAAAALTDGFFDAAVAKLDALFGAGYARENPAALAAHVSASASNFHAFLSLAAIEDEDAAFDDAILAYEEEMRATPVPPTPRGKRR